MPRRKKLAENVVSDSKVEVGGGGDEWWLTEPEPEPEPEELPLAQLPLPFFVYGTLRTGQGNWARFVAGKSAVEAAATLPNHQMYSRGIAFVVDAVVDVDLPTTTSNNNSNTTAAAVIKAKAKAKANVESESIATKTSTSVGVVGNLIWIKAEYYQRVLADLDRLESYNPRTDTGTYRRVRRVAEYTDQWGQLQRVEAWVYHAGQSVITSLQARDLVPSGDWLAAAY